MELLTNDRLLWYTVLDKLINIQEQHKMNKPTKSTTCCFTGHRFFSGEPKSAVFQNLCRTVRRLYSEGITTFISGGALGFDTLAALTVLKLRRELPDLRLLLILPCRDQHANWSDADKQTYEEIQSAADEVVCLKVQNEWIQGYIGQKFLLRGCR